MQPYNYQMQVANPFQSAVQGLQLGANIADMQAAREANAIKLQQAQQAMQAQQAAQQAIAAFYAKPQKTAQDYEAIGAYMPADKMRAMTEQFKMGSEKANQDMLGFTQQALAAAKTGNVPIAIDLINQRATAARNAGKADDAQALETWGKLIQTAPDRATDTIMAIVAGLPGGKEVVESVAKLAGEARADQMQPFAVRKAGAEATTAEAKAKYAESDALLDVQKKGWDIKKVQADMDIARQNSRIAAMNAQISREGNDLKKQELQLKVDEARTKRDDSIRAKVAEVEAARFNIDNMLNTAERILQNPELPSVLGTIQGRMPVLLSDKAQNAVALIDTLGSQAFLSQIPNVKGMGGLSNTEGDKLQTSFQNLGRVQEVDQFKANLKEAQRLLLKARKNIADRYGMPESIPDTPAATAKGTTGKSVDQILKELGVQ